jgi:hypothetical protein
MPSSIYNSATFNMKLATGPFLAWPRVHATCCFLILLLFSLPALSIPPSNWSDPEQQLARKIVAVTGPGAVALTVENRSSLSRKEGDIIGNGLRSALEALGIRLVSADRAAATVAISLSDNQTSYVWVAEIHQAASESAIAMVSTARPESSAASPVSVPLTLRKISLWQQPDRILDVAVIQENAIPTYIAVLGSEQVTLYRWRGEKWEQEQSLAIAHTQPWPRDLRGRLTPAKDHLLDVYLPGVLCHSTSALPLALNCRESDDPWPLGLLQAPGTNADVTSSPNGTAAIPAIKAFYAPTRNFFTGVVSPRIGSFSAVPKFYSFAFVPRDKYVLWLFSAVDGQIHVIDGVSDLTIKPGSTRSRWSGDIASIRSACGAGWQVLAVNSGENDQHDDSVVAYEFPDRDPVAVSPAVEFHGDISALWTEAKGDSAIAVSRNRETGMYEAFRLSVGCGQ